MTTRNLGEQFGRVVSRAADLGLEMGDFPGTMKVGGLHVPVTSARISTSHRPGEGSTFQIAAPDEHGNMFGAVAGVDSGTFIGGVNSGAQFSSPEEFAELYGTLAAPEPDMMSRNARGMRFSRSMNRDMGVRPGTIMAVRTVPVPGGTGTQEHYVYDPETGDVAAPDMPWIDAYNRWEADQRGGRR